MSTPEWTLTREEFPLDARQYLPPRGSKLHLTWAKIRSGTLHLTEEAVHLSGHGLPDHEPFSGLGCLFTLGGVAAIFLAGLRANPWAVVVLSPLLFLLGVACQVIAKHRTVRREESIPWGRVHRFVFDEGTRYAALIYRAETKSRRAMSYEVVPLRFGAPSESDALRDAVHRRSPERAGSGEIVYRWTTRRVAVAAVAALALAGFLLLMQHLFQDSK